MSTTASPAKIARTNKIIIGGIAAVFVAAGIFTLIKYLQGKKARKMLDGQPDSVPQSPASKPVQATNPSTFPLKNGSPKSSLVSQLQALLGVNADGLFGPKTQAVLLLKTGKSQIANQAEYDAVISKIQNSATMVANAARGNDLIQRWNANTALQLATIANTRFIGVTKDAYGALNPNGKDATINANYKLNRTDYTPMGVTTNGYLLFSINSGAMAGLYKTDVSKITLA